MKQNLMLGKEFQPYDTCSTIVRPRKFVSFDIARS